MKTNKTILNKLCLNITENCNFNCRYCFVQKNNNDMPFQIADKACEWLLNNALEENPAIFFFGGEPMLQWDNIIVPLVNKYPQIQYSITTNGSLLTEEKISFLAQNNFSVMLSMDGNELTQSFNRDKLSFKYLNNIISCLLHNIPNTNFRGTIIPNTCEHTFENICYAYNKGFTSCYFTINIFENWDKYSRIKLEDEINKFTLAYINSFVNNKPFINFMPFTDMIKLIIKQELNILNEQATIYKCGLGHGYGAVDYKGDIYTCQEIITYRDNNQQFLIGNIFTGLDQKAINSVTNQFINEIPITSSCGECTDCKLLHTCKKHTCQINNFICNNNCLVQTESQCWWNKILYDNAALAIRILQNNPNFQKHIKDMI